MDLFKFLLKIGFVDIRVVDHKDSLAMLNDKLQENFIVKQIAPREFYIICAKSFHWRYRSYFQAISYIEKRKDQVKISTHSSGFSLLIYASLITISIVSAFKTPWFLVFGIIVFLNMKAHNIIARQKVIKNLK